MRRYIDLQKSRCRMRTRTQGSEKDLTKIPERSLSQGDLTKISKRSQKDLYPRGAYLGGHHCLYVCAYLVCTCLSISPDIGSQYLCKMLQAFGGAWITVSVDHVVVLTKDRPLSVVPIIVDYYTGSVNRPLRSQGPMDRACL